MGAGGEGIDGATGCVAEGPKDVFFHLVHACWLTGGAGCCAGGGGVDGCGASSEDDGEEEDDGEGCEDELELFVFVAAAEGGEGEGPFSSLFLWWLLCINGGGGVEKGGW